MKAGFSPFSVSLVLAIGRAGVVSSGSRGTAGEAPGALIQL